MTKQVQDDETSSGRRNKFRTTEQVQDDGTSSEQQKEQGTNFCPVKEAPDCNAELVSASLVKNG